ncbi:Translocation protein sec72 [Escovopsis weberi]|uniref:Translocation protein sec72 n=1 Tax=Escovopsis weberi TaxID=150374 RepID=A0A0M8N850_ESCWE|nr:Translocation protein sec72 [Escovopsis weberi]
MADLDHFDMLAIHMDPQSKAIQSSSSSRALAAELEALNALHRAILNIEVPPGAIPLVPPPPIPVNPKRTANISRLRDQGNQEYKKQRYGEAARLYTQGIGMALGRPLWEPSALVREEVSALLSNRAAAHIAVQNWPEGCVDAEASVEARRVGNAKGWWRRGRCLLEMGRLEEAREWVKRGLETEAEEGELVKVLKEIEDAIENKKGKKDE